MTRIHSRARATGRGRVAAPRPLACLCFLLAVLAIAVPARGQQVARIAAVVNDEVISVMDLRNRADLVVFSSGLPATREVYDRLMPQVLQALIDERLQLQEANARSISVADREIEAVLRNMEQSNNLPPGGLDGFLAEQGIVKETLVSQIRANLAWRKLIRARFQRQVEVGQEEVDEAIRNMEEADGKPRNLVSEIFLTVDDPASEDRVRRSALRILQQIREGGRFEELARAFSQNASAAAGGDLGWLVQGQLDDRLEDAIATMQPGQIGGPFRTPAGYHIIMLRDRRFSGSSSPDKVTVDLRQIRLPLADSAGDDEIRAGLAAAEDIRRSIESCADLGAPLPAEAVAGDVGRLRVADLAPAIQQTVMGLGEGQISAPLRAQGAIVMLMVCDRVTEGETLPDREEVTERLRLQKFDLLARRYLRDLRRSAFLDVRIDDAYANRRNDG